MAGVTPVTPVTPAPAADGSAAPPAPADHLASDLRVAVLRLARRLRAERTGHGLTLTQLSVLAALERHGPLTPGELAAHEQVRPPSMTRTVASLAAAGLVGRAAHPTDGRAVYVTSTEKARALLAADRARREAWLDCRLRSLAPEERALLSAATAVLDRLAQEPDGETP